MSNRDVLAAQLGTSGAPAPAPLTPTVGARAVLDAATLSTIDSLLIKLALPPTTRRSTGQGRGYSTTLGLTTVANTPTVGFVCADETGRLLTRTVNAALTAAARTLGEFSWTSLQVNRDVTSAPHRDYNCAGLSAMLVRGNFTGGRLRLPERKELLDCRDAFVVFDGRELHETEEFAGTRMSIIAFTHGCADHTPPGVARQLATLGFQQPRTQEKRHQLDLALNVSEPLPRGASGGLRFLHLFAGPPGRPDGLAALLRSTGAECDEYDILQGPDGDLADDVVWDELLRRVRSGRYAGKIGGPPCSTFSAARRRGRGPRPLRDAEGAGRYGRAHLRPEKGAGQAGRALSAPRRPGRQGVPELEATVAHGTAAVQGGAHQHVSPRRVQGARRAPRGAHEGLLPVRLRFAFGQADDLHLRRRPRAGRPADQLHARGAALDRAVDRRDLLVRAPRLVGKEMPVLARTEHSAVPCSAASAWLTARAAAYPEALNRFFCIALLTAAATTSAPSPPAAPATAGEASRLSPVSQAEAGEASRPSPASQSPAAGASGRSPASEVQAQGMSRLSPVPQTPAWDVSRQSPASRTPAREASRPPPASLAATAEASPVDEEAAGATAHEWRWTQPLRPRAADLRDAETARALGGMRHPTRAVDRLIRARVVGDHIRRLLFGLLERLPGLRRRCVDAIGSQDPEAGPSATDLAATRKVLARYLDTEDVSGVHSELYDTELRAGLLEALAKRSLDPDIEATSWLRSGAPAGITKLPGDVGVFPAVCHEEDLATDAELQRVGYGYDADTGEEFANYASVDHSEPAVAEVNRLMESGYVRTFDDVESCRAWLGERPRPSKLALLEKLKDGKMKYRLILDCRRGPDGRDEHGVNAAARLAQRIVLPRGQDVTQDLLSLALQAESEHDVEAIFLDFTDAFYHVPLAHSERPFFCATFRGKWMVFLTIAQGSKNAPLIWGRLAALIMRLTTAMFTKETFRAQCYVDDPIVITKGPPETRELMMAAVVLLWRSFGLALAFRKGARGRSIGWVGLTFDLKPGTLRVSVKQSIFDELREETLAMLELNVVATKRLERYAGRANHVAGVIAPWRPFLQELRAALAASRSGADTTAPPRCVWTKRFRHSLLWIAAFFAGLDGTLHIDYPISRTSDPSQLVRIQTDASPWGCAGFLVISGEIGRWYAADITQEECRVLQQQKGEAAGQQTWECLAILIALRLWFDEWQAALTQLEVRSDSVTALSLVLHMKSTGVGPGIIAREVALLLARVPFVPFILAHTPGVANGLADRLSRLSAPSGKYRVPERLSGIPRDAVPSRDASYFYSLRPPRS